MIEYDPHRWTSHLFDLHGSMFRKIFGRVGACFLWSILVFWGHSYLTNQGGWKTASIPPTLHSIIGVALGLLLVFRTNTSYDRFWEGRKLWGGIVNESRNLARAASVHLASEPALVRSCILWTAAWAHSARSSLRSEVSLGPIAARLPAAEVSEVLGSGNLPLAIARRISRTLVEGRDAGLVTDVVLVSLDRNVHDLVDYLGGCERIKKTPLPFAYMVHLRRALILYCFTLPFALVADFGWGAMAGTLLVSYIFFGIEEIGVEIENPFDGDDNDLPLDRICGTIEHDLLGLIDDRPPLPRAIKSPPIMEPSVAAGLLS